MKKKLNVDSIQSELRGGSAFFPGYKSPDSPTAKSVEPKQVKAVASPPKEKNIAERRQTSSDTMIPRHHATTVSGNHATTTLLQDTDIFEVVRKAVKQIGKEAATHRFTLEEKNLLTDIEYTYKRGGVRTSENEITRIAINYIIEEYRQHGEESILAKILKRLNS
jgi:PBP1b-binding outer membrane lipoprotein LpoB